MASKDPRSAAAAARVGALSRSRQPHDPDLVNARRDLRAARAEEYINQVVDGWPPLTNEQINKLVTILRPGQAPPKREPSPEEIERQRQMEEARRRRADALKAARKRAAAILACAICGTPPEASVHGDGVLEHHWEPRNDHDDSAFHQALRSRPRRSAYDD